MAGRKKSFRLNPMVGAPRRRPLRRRLPHAVRRKARKAFTVAGLAFACALAATMIILNAWD